MVWLAQGHSLSHRIMTTNLRLALRSQLSQLWLTASFLILQSVRSQNVSRKHYLNIVVIIRAAVPWFSRCGLWIPGWASVKSRLFLWRCCLSRSPCCHLHQLVRSRGCLGVSVTPRRVRHWGPARDAAAAPGTLRGFLQRCTATCPVTQQWEHGLAKGPVRERLWQPYSSPRLETTQTLLFRGKQINKRVYLHCEHCSAVRTTVFSTV